MDAKEVSSQIEADYELLKTFMQRSDADAALKLIDNIGLALPPNFMNAALLKFYILINSGRDEDARQLAINMEFLGVSTLAVHETLPSLKGKLNVFFEQEDRFKMVFKPEVTEEFINNYDIDEEEKKQLLMLLEDYNTSEENYDILKRVLWNLKFLHIMSL